MGRGQRLLGGEGAVGYEARGPTLQAAGRRAQRRATPRLPWRHRARR